MFSHQVNGTGPLAGLYQLTNSEEPRCKYDSKYNFPVAFFYQGWLRIHQCLWRSLLLWDPWKRWIWDKVVFFFIGELNFPRYDNDVQVLWLNQLQCGLCSSLLPMWKHLPLTKRGPSVFAPCTITSWLTYIHKSTWRGVLFHKKAVLVPGWSLRRVRFPVSDGRVALQWILPLWHLPLWGGQAYCPA